jgi:transcription antitermination factor NusG
MEEKSTKKWFALYTCSRAEKKVYTEMKYRELDVFLPLQKVLRQWCDRKKWVEVPLITSYIFIQAHPGEVPLMQYIPGVATVVSFGGKLIPISEEEIEIMRIITGNFTNIESSKEHFTPGDLVNIIAGPLMGVKGELSRIKGKEKVVIKIEALKQYLFVDIPRIHLKKIQTDNYTSKQA